MGNSLIFDGVDLSTYGLQISGEGTYDAPKREVEMISIPGRNGEFALDKGRYENIEVTYKGAIHKPDNMSSFRTYMDNLRNELASRSGYKRLEDTFHPDEYRMAIFKDGLEPKMVGQAMASEFDITFNCKPQRYLKSGETEQTVTSGGTITNPTLFESSPLLEVGGYGEILLNGESIEIQQSDIGEIIYLAGYSGGASVRPSIDGNELNNGDVITVGTSTIILSLQPRLSSVAIQSISISEGTMNIPCTYNQSVSGGSASCVFTFEPTIFSFGNNESKTSTLSMVVTYTRGGTSYTENITFTFKERLLTGGMQIEIDSLSEDAPTYIRISRSMTVDKVWAYSTKSALGDPMYIDCEIGEAYKIEDGEVISVNNAVLLPADLPTLATGNNTITFDNTITDLKVVPRWWKI